MSYITNPISNRLKIIKGWKNALFPTKRLNYSREIVLWFKLYLFLKAYLSLKRIQLLSCEMRLSEANTRVLYVSINKLGAKKRRNNPKQLALKKIKSPLRRRISKGAKFWLYQQELSWLKQISIWQRNIIHKKLLSKQWISKPRLSSWINLTAIIQKQRHQIKAYHKISQRKNYSLAYYWKNFNLLHVKKSSIQKVKDKFWLLKQKKLLSLFLRVQKDMLFLQKQTLFLKSCLRKKSKFNLQKANVLFCRLVVELEKKKKILAQIDNLYFFSYQQNFITDWSQQNSFLKKTILEVQLKHKLNLVWKLLQEQLKSFALRSLLKKQIRTSAIRLQSLNFQTTLPYQFLMPTQNHFYQSMLEWYFISIFKIMSLRSQFSLFENRKRDLSKRTLQVLLLLNRKKQNSDFFVQYFPVKFHSVQNIKPQENEIYPFNSFLITRWKKKNRRFHIRMRKVILKSKIIPKGLYIFQLIRFQQKNRPHIIVRKKKRRFPFSRKRSSLKTRFNYRIPYRHNYFQNLKFLTTYKVKFLIQSLIQQYFTLKVQVKILWPLNQFKNLKFYRLVFPNKNKKYKKTGTRTTIKYSKKSVFGKRYIYIGQTTTHLRFSQTKQKSLKESSSQFLNLWFFNKQNFFLRNKNKLCAPKLWTQNLSKRNVYLYEKWKKKQQKKQNTLSQFNKRKFIKSFVPSLMLFSKYLEPQLLAEEIAKIVKDVKKHRWILKDIHRILRTLPLKRGLGYKIALIGRINGARKTRLFSLTKFKQHKSHQTLSENVNFAMAQAKARIGTFGIKVWVYY
jgi:hypothetical protein